MRKREFLNELQSKLSNVSSEERSNIVQYYDELIEDTIDRTGKTEEEVVSDLGDLDTIVSKVTKNSESAPNAEKLVYEEANERVEYKENTNTNDSNVETKKSNNKLIIGIVIALVTFPLWIGILIGAIGILIGIVTAGFGIGVAGVALVGYGIASLTSGLTYALVLIGVGILLIGVDIIIIPLIVKLMVFIVKSIIKGVKALCAKRRVNHEN